MSAEDEIENPTGSYHGDTLEGDEYVNTIKGLSGDDVLQGYGDADTIDGGDGIDTVIYGGSVLGVSVCLFNGVTHGGDAEGDALISIENLRGSNRYREKDAVLALLLSTACRSLWADTLGRAERSP